jgi:hypothetical protein
MQSSSIVGGVLGKPSQVATTVGVILATTWTFQCGFKQGARNIRFDRAQEKSPVE